MELVVEAAAGLGGQCGRGGCGGGGGDAVLLGWSYPSPSPQWRSLTIMMRLRWV